MENLKILSLEDNNLRKIPIQIYSLFLEELKLNNNKIRLISPDIAKLGKLKILNLEDNTFDSLPN